MLQLKPRTLAEVCPQCCKLIDSSAYRLVQDTCGHLKCRICLLQEITGCLLCNAEEKSSNCRIVYEKQKDSVNEIHEHQQRKSVITSLALQLAEKNTTNNSKSPTLSSPFVDKDTCHLIKQSFAKDILFPTDIVKRSTGNFYHLKRIFSQRFFSENNNLKKHKACGTDETLFPECDSSNQYKENKSVLDETYWKLPDHLKIHYYCTIHKTTIDKKIALNAHMTCDYKGKQTINVPFICKICLKEYKAFSKLNRHMKTHTKNTKFKCNKCGKPCIDNYALKNHERTHTESKPYSCSYCDKKFSGLQNFKRHEKQHKNEKEFMCNECGFKFITSTELKRHSITHTKVKPFTCQICSAKFSFKRTLIRHEKTHDKNLIKIKCSLCDSTFKRKDNLERHIKSAHFELKKA